MARKRRGVAPILVSILLVVLTLGVFALSANRGPESAVQQFHSRLLAGDSGTATEFLAGPESPAGRRLASTVVSFLDGSKEVRLASVDKVGTEARVAVLYSYGNNRVRMIPFVLEKVNSRWLIRADATLHQLQIPTDPGRF
jgi:hypothetical protein